ncbi:hypothetical protein QR680_016146 [Steinernema hermaphroditum]|uniref:Uncharacterized protein n=1 Tax=Steinernema hermaphroditum TaxID=289476 RepID=A0AA39HCR3_9BILA|nr:hypothetical protein QR680_016146 [Steinernema hermaphroditum]
MFRGILLSAFLVAAIAAEGNNPKANGLHDNGNHFGWLKKKFGYGSAEATTVLAPQVTVDPKAVSEALKANSPIEAITVVASKVTDSPIIIEDSSAVPIAVVVNETSVEVEVNEQNSTVITEGAVEISDGKSSSHEHNSGEKKSSHEKSSEVRGKRHEKSHEKHGKSSEKKVHKEGKSTETDQSFENEYNKFVSRHHSREHVSHKSCETVDGQNVGSVHVSSEQHNEIANDTSAEAQEVIVEGATVIVEGSTPSPVVSSKPTSHKHKNGKSASSEEIEGHQIDRRNETSSEEIKESTVSKKSSEVIVDDATIVFEDAVSTSSPVAGGEAKSGEHKKDSREQGKKSGEHHNKSSEKKGHSGEQKDSKKSGKSAEKKNSKEQ